MAADFLYSVDRPTWSSFRDVKAKSSLDPVDRMTFRKLRQYDLSPRNPTSPSPHRPRPQHPQEGGGRRTEVGGRRQEAGGRREERTPPHASESARRATCRKTGVYWPAARAPATAPSTTRGHARFWPTQDAPRKHVRPGVVAVQGVTPTPSSIAAHPPLFGPQYTEERTITASHHTSTASPASQGQGGLQLPGFWLEEHADTQGAGAAAVPARNHLLNTRETNDATLRALMKDNQMSPSEKIEQLIRLNQRLSLMVNRASSENQHLQSTLGKAAGQRDGVLAAKDKIMAHSQQLAAENKRLQFAQWISKDDSMLVAERTRLESKFNSRLKLMQLDLIEAHQKVQEATALGATKELHLREAFSQLDEQHRRLQKYHTDLRLTTINHDTLKCAKTKLEHDNEHMSKAIDGVDDLQSKYDLVEGQLQLLTEEHAAQTLSLEETTAALQEAESHLGSLQEQLGSTSMMLMTAKTKSKQQVEALEEALAAVQLANADLGKKLSKSQKNYEATNRKVESLAGQNQNNGTMMKIGDTEVTRLREKLAATEEDLKDHKEHEEWLESQVKEVHVAYKKIKENNASKEGIIMKSRAILAGMKPQIGIEFKQMKAAEEGLLIVNVRVGTPAYKLGLQKGDLLCEVQGKTMKGGSDFKQIISSTSVGMTLPFMITRDGNPHTFMLVVGGKGYEEDEVQHLRRLASRDESDFDIDIRALDPAKHQGDPTPTEPLPVAVDAPEAPQSSRTLSPRRSTQTGKALARRSSAGVTLVPLEGSGAI